MKRLNAFKIMLFVAATMLAVACGDEKDDFNTIPDSLIGTEWTADDEQDGITVTYILKFTDETNCLFSLPSGEAMLLNYSYNKPNGIFGGGSDGQFVVNGNTMVVTFDYSLTFIRVK